MADDPDNERIRRKAHELWEAEGHPHGRDMDHWAQAREIIAIQDSQTSTLLPRETGATAPVEPSLVRESHGDMPGLTDQGEHALTDISRETSAPATLAAEPAAASPKKVAPALKAVSSTPKAVAKTVKAAPLKAK